MKKIILFINLDAEFHVIKLLFEDFWPKIIRRAENCESLVLRVKFLCLKYGGTDCILVCIVLYIPSCKQFMYEMQQVHVTT